MCTAGFSIQHFHVLPTQCIYVFCVDLRTNSDYFPIQHLLTGFITETMCLLRGRFLAYKAQCGLPLGFVCLDVGLLGKAVCIRKALRPANSTKISLCLQAIAQFLPKLHVSDAALLN